jgi:CheY-like chemotaxis protein
MDDSVFNGMYKFLVADDDPASVEIISEALKKNFPRATLYTANDGQEALRKVRNDPPDYVITDLSMPKLRGDELLDQIAKDPKYKAMAMTVISGLDDAKKMLIPSIEGRFCFLSKPFKSQELIDLAKHALERANQPFKYTAAFLSAYFQPTIEVVKAADLGFAPIPLKIRTPSMTAAKEQHSVAVPLVESNVLKGEFSISCNDATFEYLKSSLKNASPLTYLLEQASTSILDCNIRLGYLVKFGDMQVFDNPAGETVHMPTSKMTNTLIMELKKDSYLISMQLAALSTK